ncbi:MAG: type II toxin-antitoxin system RelE/ParE family toxin [Acidobacteria bacterium]|nr:type II toxin-antitoxin system RelE/ParE family toxin [Acidobacteriota bacterium]
MAYAIRYKAAAERSIEKLPSLVQRRILKHIESLAGNPRPEGVKKLAGEANLWPTRVGAYRVVYQIFDDLLSVMVIRVGDRKEVYRR